MLGGGMTVGGLALILPVGYVSDVKVSAAKLKNERRRNDRDSTNIENGGSYY